MKESKSIRRISTLALRERRRALVELLPQLEQTLRGSLVERHLGCGNPDCRCARGQRHGPVWYLSVTLEPGRTTGGVVTPEQPDQVRRWIDNYQKVKQHLEKISQINRELLRRERQKQKR